jgi:hypothetical protein
MGFFAMTERVVSINIGSGFAAEQWKNTMREGRNDVVKRLQGVGYRWRWLGG